MVRFHLDSFSISVEMVEPEAGGVSVLTVKFVHTAVPNMKSGTELPMQVKPCPALYSPTVASSP